MLGDTVVVTEHKSFNKTKPELQLLQNVLFAQAAHPVGQVMQVLEVVLAYVPVRHELWHILSDLSKKLVKQRVQTVLLVQV